MSEANEPQSTEAALAGRFLALIGDYILLKPEDVKVIAEGWIYYDERQGVYLIDPNANCRNADVVEVIRQNRLSAQKGEEL